MIEHIFIKNYIGFDEVSIETNGGLVIFSGPSGAGKSVLIGALLGAFGLKDPNGEICEVCVEKKLNLEELGLEEDEPNIFRVVKDQKSKYYLNNRLISKKTAKQIGSKFLNYLALREFDEFKSENILNALNLAITFKDPLFADILSEYKNLYESFLEAQNELLKIQKDEKEVENIKEFLEFEIKKITSISPKIGEYEELIEKKKLISKKDKILEALNRANEIFKYENAISLVFDLFGKNGSFFLEPLSELRIVFEEEMQKFYEIDEGEIEPILNRIEEISGLVKKYGSIEEALEVLETKKNEFEKYKNIEFEKHELEKKVEELKRKTIFLAQDISKKRVLVAKEFKERLEDYLLRLHLGRAFLEFRQKELGRSGIDEVQIGLEERDFHSISSGELNRLRLAYLSVLAEFGENGGKIFIIDEIDANLSGKESQAVAQLLKKLSLDNQIFAISHQPQLSAKADLHFLVSKSNESESNKNESESEREYQSESENCSDTKNNTKNNKSTVRKLQKEERINEIARMISGDIATLEAIAFAQKLID